MQVYLVGGAVRDARLGLPVHERDWVVVGATPEEMLRQGFRPVGRDFPVFLHPETHEEYALARTERKTAPGHTGFVFHTAADVTLDMDLQRRDLTINAMAEAADGGLIDPCGGAADLQARLLRHVSPAFNEDPLRVLRVARFAARLAPLGFTVATETMVLMRGMVAAGELATLSPERVWRELSLALASARPRVFFDVLRDAGALAAVLPLLNDLERSEPGGGAALASLDAAAQQDDAVAERFAALVGGAALAVAAAEASATDPAATSSARTAGALEALVKAAGVRARQAGEALRAPRAVQDPAVQLAEVLPVLLDPVAVADTVLRAAERLDPSRRPERLALLEAAMQRLLQARQVSAADRERVSALVLDLPQVFDVDVQALRQQGLAGAELGVAIRAARLTRLTRLLQRLRAAGGAP